MLELMKRAGRRAVMAGNHPTKIVMTQEIYDRLTDEAAQYMYSEKKESDYSMVLGMQIEVRNDMDRSVLFYIS